MKRFLTLLLILVTVCSSAAMRGGAQYDPDAARRNLSNVVDAMTLTLSGLLTAGEASFGTTGTQFNSAGALVMPNNTAIGMKQAGGDIKTFGYMNPSDQMQFGQSGQTAYFPGSSIVASGVINTATGTAATPAYSFGSDPDTGIYSVGANSLGFSVGGNTNDLTASGFTLADEMDFTLSASSSGHNNRLQWAYDGTPYAWIERVNSDGSMAFTVQSDERMRISGGGNVLIGTSTDDGGENKLQVNGNIFSKQEGATSNYLTLDNSGTSYDSALKFRINGGYDSYFGDLSGSSGLPSGSLTGWVNGAARFSIASPTGNILIGTTTDDGANKLQVNGSMRLVGGAAPTAIEGAIYFNSTDKHLYVYNGTGWVQLDN